MTGIVIYVVLLRLVRPHPEPHDAALLLLLAGALEVVGLPFASALSRRFERTADRFSLATMSGKDAYIQVHRRLALANLADLDPPKLAYLLVFSHPTPPERLAAVADST